MSVNAGEKIYFVQNDHLGTPRTLTDVDQQIVWKVGEDPFGDATPSVETVVNNIRFPGQYFDSETGLHYNWNRYYDPLGARYVSSDPVGLYGGINTYEYAIGNPLAFTDPTGLWIKPSTQLMLPKPKPRLGLPAPPKYPALPPPPKYPALPPPPGIRPYPGNNPALPPGKGWVWSGKPGSKPGGKDGNWYNPLTKESLRPDISHPRPIGPHWDWKAPNGKWYRIFPDGKISPKIPSGPPTGKDPCPNDHTPPPSPKYDGDWWLKCYEQRLCI